MLEKTHRKIMISLPQEMCDILDDYADFYGFSRSGAIAFLLAKGLAQAAAETNDFDFNSVMDIDTSDDGKKIFIRRKDIKNYHRSWCFALGRKGKVVSDKDFD